MNINYALTGFSRLSSTRRNDTLDFNDHRRFLLRSRPLEKRDDGMRQQITFRSTLVPPRGKKGGGLRERSAFDVSRRKCVHVLEGEEEEGTLAPSNRDNSSKGGKSSLAGRVGNGGKNIFSSRSVDNRRIRVRRVSRSEPYQPSGIYGGRLNRAVTAWVRGFYSVARIYILLPGIRPP